MGYIIREVQPGDVERIHELSGVLGYPVGREDIQRNIALISSLNDHGMWVAEADGRVVGWIHVFLSYRIESRSFGEIGGIIVDEAFRNQGVARSMIRQAVRWLRGHRINKLRVRMNEERRETTEFYTLLGFNMKKKQHVFDMYL